MWLFGIFRGEFWSVKFIEKWDFFQVLFEHFKKHGPKRKPEIEKNNRNTKSAIGLCTILYYALRLLKPQQGCLPAKFIPKYKLPITNPYLYIFLIMGDEKFQ